MEKQLPIEHSNPDHLATDGADIAKKLLPYLWAIAVVGVVIGTFLHF